MEGQCLFKFFLGIYKTKSSICVTILQIIDYFIHELQIRNQEICTQILEISLSCLFKNKARDIPSLVNPAKHPTVHLSIKLQRRILLHLSISFQCACFPLSAWTQSSLCSPLFYSRSSWFTSSTLLPLLQG